ncbi:MAG: TIGR03619 family F420-dependent LLM class oxidoreductase [Actinomycetota bacterium]
MDIGLHLPSAQPAASGDGILTVARSAERLGFDTVWMFDHLFTPSDLDSAYPYSPDGSYALSAADPFFDPLGLYGVLAGATERLKLAAGVMIGVYRHPIVLAKALATIENFAPGRVMLGLGSGWMREEFEALGVPFEGRGRRLTEYIAALRAVWSGEAVAFDGEFYSWPEAGFLPAPTSPIPVIVGGHSDRALRRAAHHGDGWAVVTGRGQGNGIDAVAARFELLDRYLEEAGRSREGFHLSYQHPLWFSDRPSDKMPFTGPPEVVAGNLKRLADRGVTMVDLLVFGPPELIVATAERFAEEVKPLL